MNEPTLRNPTKKAFYFPTSAEVHDEKPTAKATKAAKAGKTEKAAKDTKATKAAKRANAKEKPVQTAKKTAKNTADAAAVTTAVTAEAPAEVAAEVTAKAKAPRAKKQAAKQEVKQDARQDVKKEAKKESVKKESAKKEKVVRDSFTMPKADYEKIATLKKKCLEAGITVKKSELLRAGLLLLDATSEKRLLAAVAAVETVKTGRPAKSA